MPTSPSDASTPSSTPPKSPLVRRIQSELAEFESMSAEDKKMHRLKLMDDSDLRHIRGIITGPCDTPYAGGEFEIDFQIPANYPFQAPKTTFVTHVWHPNVSSSSGYICLDTLRQKWAAGLSLRALLLSIQVLLASPVPSDPQDATVASQMTRDKKLYEQTAKYWTAAFATPDKEKAQADRKKFPEFETKLDQLKKDVAGDTNLKETTEHKLISALSCNGWDVTKAKSSLVKSGTTRLIAGLI